MVVYLLIYFIVCFWYFSSYTTAAFRFLLLLRLALNSFYFHNSDFYLCVVCFILFKSFFFIQRDKIQIQMHALLHINILFSVVTCYIWSRLKIKKC